MNQGVMDLFIQRNRPAKWKAVSEDLVLKYDQKLPAQIIYIWKNFGFGFCEQKAVQFVNPDDFQFLLFDFDLSVLENTVFAVTALGDLLIWNVSDSSVAAIWIYSLQDSTCTRLVNEYELDQWFSQWLYLYGLISENAVRGNERADYKNRLRALGLHDHVLAGNSFAELQPGQVLGHEVSDLGEIGRFHAMDAVEYVTSWIQAQKTGIEFREISLDEKCNPSSSPKKEEPKKEEQVAPVSQPAQPVQPAQTQTTQVQVPQSSQQHVIVIQQQGASQTMLKPGSVTVVTQSTPSNVQAVANTIIERLRACRFEPAVVMKTEDRKSAILDSKLGGNYYYPATEQPPTNLATGEPLFLLAQINFLQVPHLKDFPENGLLQFFIDPNPFMFRQYYNPMEQVSWRIVYYPELPSYMQIDKNGFAPRVAGGITSLPFSSEQSYALRASDKLQRVHWDDFPLNAMLNRHCSDLMPQDPKPEDLSVLREARKLAISTLQGEFQAGVTADKVIQMAGVPSFTGKDPRGEDPRFPGIKVPNVLLLQLPSADGVNWGGDNYAHFFISRKDLREKNFSRVFFDVPVK
ncbi:MAG: DUF1963 domain-containing protein [Proteobacteria bacterium]|nr:DUF1963 domain-containing protein [Pseudomonadota bacterium]